MTLRQTTTKRRCTSIPAHLGYRTSILISPSPFSPMMLPLLHSKLEGSCLLVPVSPSCSHHRLSPITQQGVVRSDTRVTISYARCCTVISYPSSRPSILPAF